MVATQMAAGLGTQGTQTNTRRRHGHLARTLTMASLTIALLLGMFGVGPQAVQDLFVENADAAGTCTVISTGFFSYYNGHATVQGAGSASCSYAGNHDMTVRLYANGYLVKSARYTTFDKGLAVKTAMAWAYCGTKYQVSVTHYFNGYGTTHWSNPFYRC